jgi:hypothetical protein
MTKSEIFKSKFPDFCGTVGFFTDDCQMVNFIDVESDLVEFTTSVTANCGCCSDTEQHMVTLSEMFDDMSESDFEEFIKM